MQASVTADCPAPGYRRQLGIYEDLGGSVPTGTPPVTNLIYVHGGPGSAVTYFAITPSQNESFAGGNKHWATIAVEMKRP
jgi:hypothetical protein